MMSIMGRISGVMLSGLVLIYLVSSQWNEVMMTNYVYYSVTYFIWKSEIGGIVCSVVVIYFLFMFYYHLYFGIRNIIWFLGTDRVKMEVKDLNIVGRNIVIASLVSGVVSWIAVLALA